MSLPETATRPLTLLQLGLVVALATAVGAAFGSWFGGQPTGAPAGERAAAIPVAIPGSAERDRSLEQALDLLTTEVRALRAERAAAAPPSREAVAMDGAEQPADAGAWIVALERAAAALTMAANRASAAAGEVRVPRQPMRFDRIQALMQLDPVEANLDHVFWSVQQVVDTYGRPTQMNGGHLAYAAPDGDFHVSFSLKDGRVHNVSY